MHKVMGYGWLEEKRKLIDRSGNQMRKKRIGKMRDARLVQECCRITVIQVYDMTDPTGRVCGNNKIPDAITSTGYRMLVTYKSSSSGKRAYRGFKANYEGTTFFSLSPLFFLWSSAKKLVSDVQLFVVVKS